MPDMAMLAGRAPESPDADPGERPPSVWASDTLPPPDPACPKDAPAPGTPCEVALGTALTCAWELPGETARCACVSRQDDGPDTPLLWDCGQGASGEGPATDTCPINIPTTGSACVVAGSNCRYAAPGVVSCSCKVDTMRWDCDGASGARGGE